MKIIFNYLTIIIIFLAGINANSQTLTEISSPSGFDEGLGTDGYRGNPINYNGNLYLKYESNFSSGVLFQYDGLMLTEISSPSGYTINGRGYIGSPVVYDNELYLSYQGDDGNFDLIQYNGTNLTAIPSPVGFENSSRGYLGNPIVYDDTLYLRYIGNDGNRDLFKYNGTTLTEISSPAGFNGNFFGYEDDPIIYSGDLYLRYRGNNSNGDLFKYNGTTLTEISSPSGFELGAGYLGNPIVYNGELYLQYSGNDGNKDLFKYDGTTPPEDGSTLTEIPSPVNFELFGSGYQGFPIVYNGELYLQYQGNDNNYDLFKYDGTTLTEISSPSGFAGSFTGYYGEPIVYNGHLYLRYAGDDNNSDLFRYDGTTLTEISSPAGFEMRNGYLGAPVVYNGKLYLRYEDNNGNTDLLEYDGTTLTEVSSPVGFEDPLKGYEGMPFVHDGALYLRYEGNDDNFDLFSFAPVPEITVKGNNTTIANGNTSTSVLDGTDFGFICTDTTDTASFRIVNSGTDTLFITLPIAITGANDTNFSILQNPVDTILMDDSTEFTVLFTSTGVGSRSATIAITNTDLDMSPYTFNIMAKRSLSSITMQSITVSSGGSIIVGTNTYDTTGTYVDVFMNLAGCDSTVTTNLTVIDNSVSISGNTITAGASGVGVTYQWIDCENVDTSIIGATNQSYTPTESGNYAVVITQNGVSDTSGCVNMVITGIEEKIFGDDFKLYPNPTNGDLVIELGQKNSVDILISDVTGKVVYFLNNINKNRVEIDTRVLIKGVYLVKVKSNNRQKIMKLFRN